MSDIRLCKDCKHYNWFFYTCKSPENGINLVSGKPEERKALVNRCHPSYIDRCGPDGKYFAIKLSPVQLWLRFWRRHTCLTK